MRELVVCQINCLIWLVLSCYTLSGMRYARNQMLVNIMRDYGYVDA